jgi:hypothetical protein
MPLPTVEDVREFACKWPDATLTITVSCFSTGGLVFSTQERQRLAELIEYKDLQGWINYTASELRRKTLREMGRRLSIPGDIRQSWRVERPLPAIDVVEVSPA